MTFRPIIIFCLLIFATAELSAQRAFPVKVNNLWGLMDADGEIIITPAYEAIGEFKKFGYAVMQREKKVGVINEFGREVIAPRYQDIKVLDSTLFAVMIAEDWMVINLEEAVILEKGYERVQIWSKKYLGYRQNGKWGVRAVNGDPVISPAYEDLTYLPSGYFQSVAGNKFGLLTEKGEMILPPEYDQIQPVGDSLFFCRQKHNWGAVNQEGSWLIPVAYQQFNKISDHFYRLKKDKNTYAYAVATESLITGADYDDFYPFSKDKILCKKDRLLGLLNESGDEILPAAYNEIQPFGEHAYRFRRGNGWGIISGAQEIILSAEFSWIGRPNPNTALVRNGGNFGALDLNGNLIIPIEYDRIEWNGNQARAFKGETLKLYDFDESGTEQTSNEFKKHFTITIGGQRASRIIMPTLTEDPDFALENFEWFYSSADDKWGLRKLSDGSIQIEPSFHTIRVERRHNLTIVGIENYNHYNFEKTHYRFDMVYGIVNNEVGLLVTGVDMLDIRLSDFSEGSRVARCVFSSGRHGLISNNPIGLFVKKDYAYIGDFHDGVARMSIKGRLSGKLKAGRDHLENLNDYLDKLMSGNYMVDYTLYDQEFETQAGLVCEGCEFGYVDTVGNVIVQPQFSVAENFVNEVGIVKKEQKWGMVDATGKMLIPCKFDRVDFLENTDNKIIRISNNSQRYGVIDTLGEVVVDLKYDKIGIFKEGRLAVMRNGKWGFVDPSGHEIIPCRYSKVNDFSNKLASVKLGRKWGFIDQQGKVVIDFKYRKVGNFSDGLAWVATIKGVGYIDLKGELAIPLNFSKAYDFEQNVARVVVNGEWGLINKVGKYFLKPKYSKITKFSEHGTAVVRMGSSNFKYGLINRTGNILTNKKYKRIGIFSEGMAPVRHKGLYGFINSRGKLVIEPRYSKISGFHNGRAMVQREGECGYVNKRGEEVIDLEYSKCLDFAEDRAVVYHGYRQGGIIDTMGQYIVDPNVNRLLDFSNGHGLVRDQHYRFYYISEGSHQSDAYYQQAGEFRYGVAVVQKNDKWGIINQRGIEVIPPKYDKIEAFKDGYAIIRIKRFSGLTNLNGEIIIQPEYEYISYAGKGLFRIEQGDKIGYFSSEGEWVWGLRE